MTTEPIDAALLILTLAATLALLRLAARSLGARLSRRLCGFIFLLPFLAVGPRLVGDELLAPSLAVGVVPGLAPRMVPSTRHEALNDVPLQLLPWEAEVRRLIAAGAMPFWSHTLAGGSSLWSNPQAQTASPIAWLTRIFPLEHHLLAALCFKVLVAAAGAAALARRLGFRHWIAAWAAATFALSGAIAAWGLFPLSSTVAWAPWAVIAVLASVRSPLRAAPLATGALLVACLLLSGHPESAAVTLLLAAAVTLAFARRSAPRRWRPPWRALGRAAAVVVLGLLIAAPSLLPAAHTVAESVRYRDIVADDAVPRPGEPLARLIGAGDLAFAAAPLAAEVFGRPYHEPFRGPYNWPTALAAWCGLQTLAGWALALGARRRGVGLFAGFALACLLVAMKFGPIDALREALPLLSTVEPSRFLPVGCLAAILAAAYGWRAVAGSHRRAAWTAAALWTLALLLATSLFVAPTARTAAEWLVTLGLLALLARRAGTGMRWLLAPAQALFLAIWGWDLLPATSRAATFERTAVLERLAEELAPLANRRLVGSGFDGYPNLLPFHGFTDARFHDPLAPASYAAALARELGFAPSFAAYFAPVTRAPAAALAELGLCCVFASGHSGAVPENGRIVELGAGFRLHVVFDDLPLARRVPERGPPPRAALGPNRLSLTGRFQEGDRIETFLTSPAGWRVEPAALATRAPLGERPFVDLVTRAHDGTLVARFEPPGFRVGLAAAAVAFAALIALAARDRRRRSSR